ncbi:XdhC family protein [Paracoccus sp. SCSIO 75233]|uniref:XdhC family protein n=1 Tax=Paracoccus sp. SCSIO 75233 TaxID=3017782 RepID=UPI0022F064EA|nr:XdhC family protein [Paracoccus sp. SCSIO 75233]WBU52800.1 XdhC family protein [Paracoccus sp. SCSIO 75233]
MRVRAGRIVSDGMTAASVVRDDTPMPGPSRGLATDPVQAILNTAENSVLALVAGVEGPSYRPLGAMMAVLGGNRRVGSLSSGCIESDISAQAMQTLQAGIPRMLRYGRGSPFIDIQLPCGGGLDILLLPKPDREVCTRLQYLRRARKPCALSIALDSGTITVTDPVPTYRDDLKLSVLFEPPLRFLTFGKGPEASTFSALVQSAGYPNLLLSPDGETLDQAAAAGCETRPLARPQFPSDLEVDARSAIVLFFHDHDWEPPLLAGALRSPAFYIGAQGSMRARDQRLSALREMAVAEADLARLFGPVGLIRSARDPGTLAVSVLAEVLAQAMTSAA